MVIFATRTLIIIINQSVIDAAAVDMVPMSGSQAKVFSGSCLLSGFFCLSSWGGNPGHTWAYSERLTFLALLAYPLTAAGKQLGWPSGRQEGEEDEGGGIPDPKLKTIFDRFYTERPSTEKFGTHSGLGLSICKQIVEIHSGNIWAENIYSVTEHKIGAKFVIALPKAKAFKTANKELGRKTLES